MTENNKVAKKYISLTTVISLMSLSIPFLYLIGYFYDLGYMEGFNVSNEFFIKSIDGYLVNAFYAFMFLTLQLIDFSNDNRAYFIFVGVIFAFLGWLYVYSEHHQKETEKYHRKISKIKYFEYWATSLFFGFLGFIIPYLIILIMAVLVLIPLGAYFGGVNQAQKIIESYGECDINSLKPDEKCTLIFEDGDLKLKGFLIASSKTHMAIYNGKKSIIYPINDSVIDFYKGRKKEKI
jgi:hypothetical protein